MVRSERMGAVLTLAERAEQQAAQALESARAQLLNEQQQLEQLQQYRTQYIQEYQNRRDGVRPAELIGYSSFIQRLEAVLAEQDKKMLLLQQQLAQRQQQWQQKYRKRKSIQELIERLRQEESTALEQKLQKELDELAAQQHWHRRQL